MKQFFTSMLARVSALFALIILISPLALITSTVFAQEKERQYLLGDWGSTRSELSDKHGLSFAAIYTGDVASNLSGGLKQQTVYLSNYDLSVNLDTEKAGLWSGGDLFVYFLANNGELPSRLVGDAQGVDNIAAAENVLLFEAWYEHSFMNDRLSLLAGLYDYNSEFNTLDYASALINTSFGVEHSTAQVRPSIFPYSSLAARLKYKPVDTLYVQAMLADGVSGDPSHPRGTQIDFSEADGIFYGLELGEIASEDQSATGYHKLALGAWLHTKEFIAANGEEKELNHGVYIIGESSLIREEKDTEGLGVFFQLAFADPSRNQFGWYVGGGFEYVGLFDFRPEDKLIFGFASAQNSDTFREHANFNTSRSETAYELSYLIAVTPYLSLQPDIQYVKNPGTNKDIDDALLAIFRLQLAL